MTIDIVKNDFFFSFCSVELLELIIHTYPLYIDTVEKHECTRWSARNSKHSYTQSVRQPISNTQLQMKPSL